MQNSQTQNEPTSESCDPRNRSSCGIASNIQRLMYVLLSFALICILFLIQGGEKALMANSKAKFPIANVEVDFVIFIFFGPVLFLLLMVYLHMFLGAWDQCDRASGHEKLNCIFNCSSATTRFLFVGVFFVMTPLILSMFLYSARAVPETTLVPGLMMIVGLIYLVYQMARLNLALSWWVKGPVIGIFIAALSVVAVVILVKTPLYETYPLQVSGADLSGANFSGKKYFSGARAERTKFERSVFYKTDLKGLYAPMSNFKKADMTEADLTGADIGSADFTGAILQYATLIDAKLANTNFTRAAMKQVDLTSRGDTITTDSAIFYKSDLREAKLKRSFKWCLFVETNLRNADFSGARLTNAIFIDADLRGAKNLTQDQLQEACADSSTNTGSLALLIPPCEYEILYDVQQKILSIDPSAPKYAER